MNQFYIRKKHAIALFLLLLFHSLNFVIWLKSNVWPQGKAAAQHLFYFSSWEHRLSENLTFLNFLKVSEESPPFYHWIALILKNVFSSYKAVFCTSFVFFIFLIISIYFIGKQLKNKDVGFVAALLMSFMPKVYNLYSAFNLELATVSTVCVNISIIIYCKDFNEKIFCPFVWGAMIIGMLTRSFFPLFVIGPFIVTLIYLYKQKKIKSNFSRYYFIINMCIFFITIFFISSFAYYDFKTISLTTGRIFHEDIVARKNIFSVAHLFYYIKILPDQLGIPLFIAFLCSIREIFNLRDYSKKIILSWIFPAFIILALVLKKNGAYSISYLPAIIILVSYAINGIKIERVKKVVVFVLATACICDYFRNF